MHTTTITYTPPAVEQTVEVIHRFAPGDRVRSWEGREHVIDRIEIGSCSRSAIYRYADGSYDYIDKVDGSHTLVKPTKRYRYSFEVDLPDDWKALTELRWKVDRLLRDKGHKGTYVGYQPAGEES
jgi:hypothetical protein